MLAQKDASMDDIARFIAIAWHRCTPKLVLSVISTPDYFTPWKKKFEEDLREGLIQVVILCLSLQVLVMPVTKERCCCQCDECWCGRTKS
jgi:hypothetical protein